MSTATIVAPTGVPFKIAINIPVTVHISDRIAELISTSLKLLNNCITESAGKITRADINNEPTRFIANTMIVAIIIASIRLIPSTFKPEAFENLSSNVIEKILGYKMINTPITIIDAMTHNHTSAMDNVRMDVEPNSVLHTSPLILEDGGKIFINRYPIASDPVDIIPISASPWMRLFCPVRRMRIAATIVIGNTKYIFCCTKPVIIAIDIAPNAT